MGLGIDRLILSCSNLYVINPAIRKISTIRTKLLYRQTALVNLFFMRLFYHLPVRKRSAIVHLKLYDNLRMIDKLRLRGFAMPNFKRIRTFFSHGYRGFQKDGFRSFYYALKIRFYKYGAFWPVNNFSLNKLLKKHKAKRVIILGPNFMDWEKCQFQRPQQLARMLGEIGNLFFYCVARPNHDKINGFKKKTKNVFLTNCHDLLIKKFDKFIYWINNSSSMAIDVEFIKELTKTRKIFLIYDYLDDYHPDIYGHDRNYLKFLHQRHKYLISKADVILCSSEKLYCEVSKRRKKGVYLVPNGGDFGHFNIKRSDRPKELEFSDEKAIVGYFGSLANWIDYDLINFISKKRKDLNFVLIGQDYDGSFRKLRQKNSNLHYLGQKDYSVLPDYGVWFDVAIIPFKIGKIGQATSPIKLFEYMALGKPIVSTAIKECRQYRSVLIAKNKIDFTYLIGNALKISQNKKFSLKIKDEAKKNTWKIRAQLIDRLIERKWHDGQN